MHLRHKLNKFSLLSSTASACRGLVYYCFFCFLSIQFASLPAFAKSVSSANKLIEYLVQEKINLTLAINNIKLTESPASVADYEKLRQDNEKLMTLNQAKLVSLESFLVNQKKLQQDFTQHLKRLQQTPLAQSVQISSQERIDKINTLNEVNKKTIELLTENLVLANRYNDTLVLQKQHLKLWKAKEQMNEQLEKLRNQDSRLNDALTRLYENSIKLQQDIKNNNDTKLSYLIEAKLLLNNQIISLTQHKIAEVDLQKKLVKADYLLQKNKRVATSL